MTNSVNDEVTLENLPLIHEKLLQEIRKGIVGQDQVISNFW